jgi:hypothetical protein
MRVTATKRAKGIAQMDEVQRMVREYIDDVNARQSERANSQLLYPRAEDPARSLPQSVVNDIWGLALVRDGWTAEEAESAARGFQPGTPIPIMERQRELQEELDRTLEDWGTVPAVHAGTRREYLEQTAARREVLQRELSLYQAVRRSEVYQAAAKAQAAGLTDLAAVLATNASLWRLWYQTNFPLQVAEMPEGRPDWILAQKPTEDVDPAVAGVEDQYSNNAWRRYYAWTGFFERRCYHMMMDMAGTRAAHYTLPPGFVPQGVVRYNPVRPVEWVLQSAVDRQPGVSYVADVRYNEEELADTADVDDVINLDECATLAVDFGERHLSAPVLAYLMMSHWYQRPETDTIVPFCMDFANLAWNDPKSGDPFVFNFLDDMRVEGQYVLDPVVRNRRQRFGELMASYILCYMHMKIPNDEYTAMALQVQQAAEQAGYPAREAMLGPYEQARQAGLVDADGHWHMLEALPPVPMRGWAYSSDRVFGNGGVKFLGAQVCAE